jgi:hypothetical protein
MVSATTSLPWSLCGGPMLADRRRGRRWRHDDLDEMVDATGVSDPVPDPCPPAHFAEMRAACSAPEFCCTRKPPLSRTGRHPDATAGSRYGIDFYKKARCSRPRQPSSRPFWIAPASARAAFARLAGVTPRGQ